jgi:hypothetical protein
MVPRMTFFSVRITFNFQLQSQIPLRSPFDLSCHVSAGVAVTPSTGHPTAFYNIVSFLVLRERVFDCVRRQVYVFHNAWLGWYLFLPVSSEVSIRFVFPRRLLKKQRSSKILKYGATTSESDFDPLLTSDTRLYNPFNFSITLPFTEYSFSAKWPLMSRRCSASWLWLVDRFPVL